MVCPLQSVCAIVPLSLTVSTDIHSLDQAASLMRKKNLEPAQYRKKFEEKRAELLSDADTMASNTYHLPVWSTWEVSIDAISEKATDQSRDALELLYLLSCLNYRNVPQRLFRRAWKRVNYGMVADEWVRSRAGAASVYYDAVC